DGLRVLGPGGRRRLSLHRRRGVRSRHQRHVRQPHGRDPRCTGGRHRSGYVLLRHGVRQGRYPLRPLVCGARLPRGGAGLGNARRAGGGVFPALARREATHRAGALGAYRIVTSSSALVGWMATVSSKSSLVAPMRTATANPCIISSAPGPTTCTPTTRRLGPTVTSFMSQRGLAIVSAWYIGMKLDLNTLTDSSP